MLTLTATVVNVFPTNEFKDQKTGEITPAGHKVQMQYSEPVKGGGEPNRPSARLHGIHFLCRRERQAQMA